MRTQIRIALYALTCLAAIAAFDVIEAAPPGESPGRKYTSVERMALERLKAAHEDAQRYQQQRREISPIQGYFDFRVILHAHAEDAAHTGGTRPEMLEDAKKAGVQVIMLTDHYRPPRDFMDTWRGIRDGVLFIPGSESHGFLLYPENSIVEFMAGAKESLIGATAKGEGLIFLSHIEERLDHPMDGLSGMEIYNRHADAKDDNALLVVLMNWVTDPKQVPVVEEAVRLYPDEVLAVQLDYPKDYLDKWDRETPHRRITGVAANDCHHNQVFIVKMVDERAVRIGTIVDSDEDMRLVTADQRPGITEMTRGRQPGDVLVQLDFDPYYRSFRNVSTHLLAKELTETAIREALREGRAYVSHDWMCDPTGFRFLAVNNGETLLMGAETAFKPGWKLEAEFPVACNIRLIRNGQVLHESKGDTFNHPIADSGVYRIEGWLTIDGEERVWIYSNPIYFR